PSAVGWSAVLHAAHEDAVTRGQTDRRSEPPGHARRSHGYPEPGGAALLAPGQAIDPLGGGGSERYGQDQARVESHAVERQELAVEVDQRASGGAPRKRSCVLNPGRPLSRAGAAEAG